jgi:hypothetical protein
MNATNLDLQSMRDRMGVPRTAVTTTAAQQNPPPENDTDEEECAAFGYLRGIRDRALSLEFRLANGNSESHSYSWLGPMKYNPSAGLLLKLVGDMVYLVLLEGSNLNTFVNGSVSLYSGIQRHRITWVREATSQQAARAGAGEVTVERIRMVSHRPDEEPKGVDWLKAFAD